jgi:hypothetical protein
MEKGLWFKELSQSPFFLEVDKRIKLNILINERG